MVDDTFHIEIREDGIYLGAYGKGDYSLPSVVGYLQSCGVENYDSDLIGSFLENQPEEPFKVAERDPGSEKEARCACRISSDGMKAELWIDPPFLTKPWPTMEETLSFLAKEGVVKGIDQGAIQSLLSSKKKGEWITVASGSAPLDGTDADVEYRVQFGSARPKEVEESERADLKNLSSVTIILKNQLLAEKIPAKEGVDGVTVKGVLLRAKNGKDRPLPSGEGTVVSEDGMSLHSLVDGNLVLRGGKLHVLPVFQVDGDVDYSVGNIHFIGAVLVNGAVREGFEIVSSGNIEIRGMVEGAHLKSRGDISVTGGIRGMGKGDIEADGSIAAGFIDQARVRSGKDITVTNAVLHSDMAANGTITVLGGQKSQIAGGKIQAGQEIRCLTLGSEMGTKTEVIVGVLSEISEKRRESLALLADNELKLEKIDANIAFLKKLEAMGQLDDNKRALLISLTKAKFQLQSQCGPAKETLAALNEQMESSKAKGCVRVKGKCFSGVTVSMRGLTYMVKEEQQYCTFVFDEGEIRIKPFDF